MTFKTGLGSACALALTALAPSMTALAAPPAVETKQVFNAVTKADIISVLDELGWEHEPSEEFKDFTFVTTADGWVFHIGTRVCDLKDQPPGCLGIEMLGYWGMDDLDEAALAKAVTKFNQSNVIGKAWIGTASDSDLAAWMARYVITDNGISRGNIYANLIEFNAAMGSFDEALFPPAE